MTSQPLLPELVRDTRLQASIQGEFTVHTRPFGRRRHEKWVRKNILGHGGCGIVWLERRIKDGTQEEDPGESRAVKRIDTSRHRFEHDVRELEALAKFSQDKYSDFFVKFFGWYDSPGYLYIAMEYCEHGDLKKYLADNNNVLPENQVREIISQVLAGLAMMHEAGFANRDVKPANILIKSKPPNGWWVKVCDMGLSKRTEDAVASTTVRGTPGFMPPELHGFYGDPRTANPFMADMWCLGETAFQALTGRPVFNMFTDLGQYQSGALPFPEDALRRAQAGPAAVDFIRSLMSSHPWERLNALRAAEHPWVRPAPDPVFYNHGFAQTPGPAPDRGPPWPPQFPWTPGDQLTQASGQWTVTLPYSNPTFNQPQNAPPLGFRDRMQAYNFNSQIRGNHDLNPYAPIYEPRLEQPMMVPPPPNRSFEPYMPLFTGPPIPPVAMPSLGQRNSMAGPEIWEPPHVPSFVSRFNEYKSSDGLPARERAATSSDPRQAPSPPLRSSPPGQRPASTETLKPLAETNDERSIPTPAGQASPKIPVRHPNQPQPERAPASNQEESKNTSEDSADTQASPPSPPKTQVERDVLASFKQFKAKHRAEFEARRVRRATIDKEVKLSELKKFSNTFQLSTPIPMDLVPIIAKTPEKQLEITNKQNDVVAKRRAKDANGEGGGVS